MPTDSMLSDNSNTGSSSAGVSNGSQSLANAKFEKPKLSAANVTNDANAGRRRNDIWRLVLRKKKVFINRPKRGQSRVFNLIPIANGVTSSYDNVVDTNMF